MKLSDIEEILKSNNLKVTPQRIAVMKVLMNDRTHPNAEKLIKAVLKENPYISVGTIYNILDTLVNKGIVEKIHTEDNIMRYDPVTDEHHHIFMMEDGEIVDYFDNELTEMVKNYLAKKQELNAIQIKKIRINLLGNRK